MSPPSSNQPPQTSQQGIVPVPNISGLLAERDALRAQLQAVTDLHQPEPVLEGDGTVTARFRGTRCQICKVAWSCPTYQAATGEA